MSPQQLNRKIPSKMTPKPNARMLCHNDLPLTDTQLIILSRASQHPDGHIILPDQLRGAAAMAVLAGLTARGLIDPIKTSDFDADSHEGADCEDPNLAGDSDILTIEAPADRISADAAFDARFAPDQSRGSNLPNFAITKKGLAALGLDEGPEPPQIWPFDMQAPDRSDKECYHAAMIAGGHRPSDTRRSGCEADDGAHCVSGDGPCLQDQLADIALLEQMTSPRETRDVSREVGRAGATKLSRLVDRLCAAPCSLADLGAEAGWQAHTIRAALSRLRKSGKIIVKGRDGRGATTYQIDANSEQI